MKTTTNHGLKKPDGTDIVNIEDLNYNADTIDGLLVPATTTANGLMSKDDKTKLNGIATGANNYTHPATHPASMISGLHAIATSGSYDDLLNKPITFPPSSHTHTKSQITDFPTSLPANGGNADTVDGKHASDFVSSTGGTINGPIKITSLGFESGQIRIVHGDTGFIIRTDGADTYFMVTEKGDPNGTYTSSRPITILGRDGTCLINGVSVASEINSLKSSVVSGKQDVANAINGKSRSSFNSTSPFADMAWWIRNKMPIAPMTPPSTSSSRSIMTPIVSTTRIEAGIGNKGTITGFLLCYTAKSSCYVTGSDADFFATTGDSNTKYTKVTKGVRTYLGGAGGSTYYSYMVFNPNRTTITFENNNTSAYIELSVLIP